MGTHCDGDNWGIQTKRAYNRLAEEPGRVSDVM